MVMASLLGLGAFLYPFFRPSVEASGMMAHASDAPLLFILLLVLCLGAVFASLTGGQMTSKMVAVLGILTALSAVLRRGAGAGGVQRHLPAADPGGLLLRADVRLPARRAIAARFGADRRRGGAVAALPDVLHRLGGHALGLAAGIPAAPALGTGDAGRMGFHGGVALRRDHEHLVLAVPGRGRGSRARAGSRA